MYNVRVREDYRYSSVRIGGRIYTKRGEEIAGADVTDEMRMRADGEGAMLVIESPPSVPPASGGEDEAPSDVEDAGDGTDEGDLLVTLSADATDAARELAAEAGIELALVFPEGGSGADGRILLADVEAVVSDAEED